MINKQLLSVILLALCSITFTFAQNSNLNTTTTTDMDNMSYAIGVLVSTNLKQQGLTDGLDPESFKMALQDVINGTAKMTPDQANQEIQKKMEALAKVQQAKDAVRIEEEAKFLAANANKPNIKMTASGVQYEILKAADGEIPSATDKVTVHYHGTLINGTVFDSSVERGQTISFPVNGVIQGWQEILQMMPVGSKWKVWIPSDLAYGPQGTGGIPPNSALIFEIELFSK